jgi:DnaJ-class molecular chaperone
MAENMFVDNPFVACPECGGEGQVTAERAVCMSNDNPYGYLEEYKRECDNCHGLGEIERDWESL